MMSRRTPPKRLVASAVLFGIGILFFVVAASFSAKGARWANEFSGVAGFFVALAALLSPLVGKMFNWLQQGSVELATVSPGQAAEDLAFALSVQWAQQEELRKINNPWPLPVRWQVTERARAAMLGISWEELGEAGHPVTPSALASSFEDVQELLRERIPRQRLVILGGIGFGKTVLAMRLARKLLLARNPGDPVPVLLTVATCHDRGHGR